MKEIYVSPEMEIADCGVESVLCASYNGVQTSSKAPSPFLNEQYMEATGSFWD